MCDGLANCVLNIRWFQPGGRVEGPLVDLSGDGSEKTLGQHVLCKYSISLYDVWSMLFNGGTEDQCIFTGVF